MSFTAAVASALRQYATFTGRARRAEYWWFFLFTALVSFVAGLVDAAFGTIDSSASIGLVGALASLALFLPSLAITVRRLHDVDRSGWWVLAFLIPLVGFVLWLVLMCSDSNPQANRFGPSPKPSDVVPGVGYGGPGYASGTGAHAGYGHDPMTLMDDRRRHDGDFDRGSSQ
jgi:uncharacterized membrane protein YhaH (DUF805 family)